VDVLFDGLDRLMSGLRRRYPRTLLVVSLALWLLVAVAFVAVSAVWAAWVAVGLITVPAVALAVTVAVRGLRRTPWWIWGAGAGWVVFLAGLLAPVTLVNADEWRWLVSLLCFVYAQIYLGMLIVLDHLWIRRHGGRESVEDARSRLRRTLQARLLLANLVATTSIWNASRTEHSYPGAIPEPYLPYADLVSCCCMPILVAVWFRWRPLAWACAGLLTVLFLANLAPTDGDNRQQAILEFGWVVLVAIYLWTKAARVWYWPMSWPKPPPPPPPGYAFPWPPPFPYGRP
jgi:hypothetical protein